MHTPLTTRKKISTRGFTLVELMVSLTVFSIVITIALGTLLVMIDLNAKAQALYSSSTNLSYALDSMTREIRMGYKYYCAPSMSTPPSSQSSTSDCASGSAISFTRERDGKQIAYRKNGTVIEQWDDAWDPITSEKDVVVDSFEIVVSGSSAGGTQPTASIRINGYMYNGLDVETPFSLETQIVSRRIDIPL